MKSIQSVRRFIHTNGCWANIAIVEDTVVSYSGTGRSTVPYFGRVKHGTRTPRAGRSADEELGKLATDYRRRNYIEITPTKKPAGETKINGLWRRLENWLCEHTPVFCRWPLALGASEQDIQTFEKTIGAILPVDVRASYLRHNGSAGVNLLAVVGEGKWVTLKESASHWKFFREIKSELEEAGFLKPPLGPMKEVQISAGWIPISDNSGGDHLCIDLDPAKGGKVGQLFSYWHEYGAWRIVAPSFTAFLEHLLKHLEQGKYAIDECGQLVPVKGPSPQEVSKVQDYFQKD